LATGDAQNAYSVRFKPAAERDLKKIKDRAALKRILAAIADLAKDPRPPGIKALQGDASILRMRVARYRVLYTISDTELLVLVVAVGHRREAYR
jgi:mRNA interferase RelE/StbE